MKNYSEIYVSLREEIMQAIDEKVDNLLAEYDVDNLSDLENAPTFKGYITKYVEDGLCGGDYMLVKVELEDIFVGGECSGYGASMQLESYSLSEFITDSLIEIYEKLCEYGN